MKVALTWMSGIPKMGVMNEGCSHQLFGPVAD
jgi:hypothetical protein